VIAAARVLGTAIDARAIARTADPRARAFAARWIARNLLAARGVRPPWTVETTAARVIALRVATWSALVAAIAALPMLVDESTLPRWWRVALRLVGIPLLDRPIPSAIAAGVSVARVVVQAREPSSERMLAM
jgi:hypothetical protein